MKTREEFINKFTLDAEIEEWVVGDESSELHGYVDFIEGMKVVQSGGKPTNLFKVTVNNGVSRRVKVCFWGDLAKTYSQKIRDRTVISIVQARTVIPQKKFHNPNDIVEELELYVLPSTVIDLHNGEKFPDEVVDVATIPTVEIENVYDHNGQCYIQGFLKQELMKVTAYGSTFLSGLLVNGTFKIQIKIGQYEETKKFTKGIFLRVLGKLIKTSQPVPQFLVRNLEDIEIVDSVKVMEEKDLRLFGHRTPKRKLDSRVEENSNNKRSPF